MTSLLKDSQPRVWATHAQAWSLTAGRWLYDKEMYVLVSSRHVPNLTKLDPENGKMDGILFVAEEGMNFMLYVLKMPGDTSFASSIINNILTYDNIYFF